MVAVLVLASALFGLAIGSFLNVVIHRVPARLSVVHPRSQCPSCGTEIAPRDNVPVLSWVILRGRCRACHAPISARYPLIETGTAMVFGLLAGRFGFEWELLAYFAFAAGLIALSAVDLERFLLPNRILYPTLWLCGALLVMAAIASDDWDDAADAVVGGAVAWLLLFVIHLVSPRGMGFGDVRLAGLLGLLLGWLSIGHVFVGLFLGFLLGAVLGVVLIALGVRSRKDRIPFGPFLAAGALLTVFVGEPILRWYH